mgnify:FL=1|jgi:hypothetical protein|tara:strand:- start:807 stop:1511 length:705 start_codon:yes stop_codon:yes gene_type:complete
MGHTYGESDRNPITPAGYGLPPDRPVPSPAYGVAAGWDTEYMGARPTKIVVSGPNPRGLWHWRHHDGTEGYHEVPAGLADPDWKSGTVVTARVTHHHGGPIIVAIGNSSVDQPGDAPTLLVNGEPFEVSAERELEPGVVVTAVVRYRQNAGAQDGESEAKRRPAVVVDVGPLTVSVRGVFSRNTEGRGQRLRDWQEAGLHSGSVIEHDETIVSRGDVGEVIGRLSDVDRQRLGF